MLVFALVFWVNFICRGLGGSSLERKGQESIGPVFGFCPDSEAESGQSKPYLSLCYCLAASITTKRALFWTVQQDQQIQDSKKERAREREREISGHWKRSPLRRSLMYGLIWASTVVRVCSTGLEFTKLMTHIKAQNIRCFVSLLDCGRIQRVHFLVLPTVFQSSFFYTWGSSVLSGFITEHTRCHCGAVDNKINNSIQ